MEPILQTRGLTKYYGRRAVVNAVDMHIRRGDIYGFIGKNGAGKTTAMRMILGLTSPSSGEIELFGKPVCDEGRRRVGSLVETPGLFRSCSAFETLKRYSLLFGGTDAYIKELLALVGLEGAGKKSVSAFSLGMRQRLGVAIAMLGDPELLILDEPVNGLDPAGIRDVRETLLRLNRERGVTILIASHLLEELSKLATCYGIIREGVLVDEFSLEALHQRCRHSLVVRCREPEKAAQILRARFGIEAVRSEDGCLSVYEGLEEAEALNAALCEAGCGVSDFHRIEADVEAYFLERIG